MRTTLDIEEDVLQAVKAIAKSEKRSAGQVISELARRGLHSRHERAHLASERGVLGFRAFPKRGRVVTDEIIDALREDGAY